MKTIAILMMLIVTSCMDPMDYRDPKTGQMINHIAHTPVEICTKDSITIYKLWDNGTVIYFTNKGAITR